MTKKTCSKRYIKVINEDNDFFGMIFVLQQFRGNKAHCWGHVIGYTPKCIRHDESLVFEEKDVCIISENPTPKQLFEQTVEYHENRGALLRKTRTIVRVTRNSFSSEFCKLATSLDIDIKSITEEEIEIINDLLKEKKN